MLVVTMVSGRVWQRVSVVWVVMVVVVHRGSHGDSGS